MIMRTLPFGVMARLIWVKARSFVVGPVLDLNAIQHIPS